ncbi:MAG: response regulator [Candidatus Binatia bacterium]|nr:response regulator [Candidatus Binatia bacterium]
MRCERSPEVIEARDGREAPERIGQDLIDLALSMPGMTGTEVLSALRTADSACPDVAVIVLAGVGTK